jgi:hypothetical protein
MSNRKTTGSGGASSGCASALTAVLLEAEDILSEELRGDIVAQIAEHLPEDNQSSSTVSCQVSTEPG